MSENKSQWLNMTTAFFVSQEYSPKEVVNGFKTWLHEEGYTEVKTEYANLYGAYYIDIASKTYAMASADVLLAPIVGFQGIEYDDFKIIHNVFKDRAVKEKDWRFRPAYLTPLSLHLKYGEIRRKQHEEDVQEYYAKKPSFEEYCNDIYTAIKEDRWYKKHRPDFSKEEFDAYLKDRFVQADIQREFDEQALPYQVAGQWDLITF